MRAGGESGADQSLAADPPVAPDNSSRPLFGLGWTLLIIALLVGPYLVYSVSTEEPYPAVILPGGASAVDIDDDQVTFEVRSFVGYDAHGEPVYLDVTDLLDPVPPSHSSALVRSMFGQDQSGKRRILIDLRVRKGAISVPRHVPSAADRAAAREWVNDKLDDAGAVPDRLEVWNERIVVDYATGDEISREQVSEVVILDR